MKANENNAQLRTVYQTSLAYRASHSTVADVKPAILLDDDDDFPKATASRPGSSASLIGLDRTPAVYNFPFLLSFPLSIHVTRFISFQVCIVLVVSVLRND